MTADRLRQAGYEVVSLDDSIQAIATLLESDVRVVLLDVEMPSLSGLELLSKIKAFDGGIQVIMLTGLVTTSTLLESMRRGAEACFFKPLDDAEPLLEALERAFAKVDCWWSAVADLERRKAKPAAAR
jgi:DNA-binding NtrC family response regulator